MNKLIPLFAFSILLLFPLGAQNVFAGPGVADLDYTIDSAVFDSNTNTITIQATIVHNGGDTVGPASPNFQAFPQFNLQINPDTQPFQWDSCTLVGEPGLICLAPHTSFPHIATSGWVSPGFDEFSSGETFTFTATGSLTGAADSISFLGLLNDPSGGTTDPDGLDSLSFDVDTSQNTVDSDGDGVPDGEDLCPGQDDLLDTDGDGIPDCLDDNPTMFCGANAMLVGFECQGTSSGGFECGDKTMEVAGFCVPDILAICDTGLIADENLLMCFAQTMGSMIGGTLLEINTLSLLVASIGVNPIITGLVGITIAGIVGQTAWFVHRRRKSENS